MVASWNCGTKMALSSYSQALNKKIAKNRDMLKKFPFSLAGCLKLTEKGTTTSLTHSLSLTHSHSLTRLILTLSLHWH